MRLAKEIDHVNEHARALVRIGHNFHFLSKHASTLLIFIILIATLVGLLYHLFTIKKKAIRKIEISNELIIKQKDEIKLINEDLENIVGPRTAKIKKQNDTFVKFAFHNAHIVRGLLSKLLGILYLFENDMLRENEMKTYISSMVNSAKELDLVVTKSTMY